MIFKNRLEAANRLIEPLKKFSGKPVVVLSIPRGGVPMGCLIAKHFGWEHGLLMTKKIGHPLNPELAIGAVGKDVFLLDDRYKDVPEEYIKSETIRIRNNINERERLFTRGGKQPDIHNKTVVIIDDGIATGYTMRASVEMLRTKQPSSLVIAVPVAPPASVKELKKFADDVIVLYSPADFSGVGQFYEDFSEVTDEMVVDSLTGMPDV